jgi:hypothetical protein
VFVIAGRNDGEIRHFWGGEMDGVSAELPSSIIEHVKWFLSMAEVRQPVPQRDKLTMPNIRRYLIRI